MASVRRALALSMAQRYLAFVMQLATSIIMARLLTPEETGIFSLSAAAVAIGHLLREFGTGDYVVSEPDLTRDKLRAAYAVTIVTAVVIALVLVLLAHPLAAWYGQPGVQSVLYLLSLNYLMLPLGSVANSVMHRNLQFGRIFIVQTAAAVVGSLVTVGAALVHQSYLSPALGSIAGIFATVACLVVMEPSTVFMLPSTKGVKAVLRFGGTLTVARLVDHAAGKSADFIISALLGFHATGLYSKATSLLGGFQQFFGSAMAQVATPALSRAAADPVAMRDAYSNAVVLMSLAQWMFFGLMAIFSSEIVQILFGEAWLGAVPVMQLGAISGILSAPFMLFSSVLTARRELHWQLRIPLVAAPVLLVCLWIGASISLEAVAASTVLATGVRITVIARGLQQACGISTRQLLRALIPTAGICGVALCSGLACQTLTAGAGWTPLATMLTGAGIAIAVATGMAISYRHPIVEELRRAWFTLNARARAAS